MAAAGKTVSVHRHFRGRSFSIVFFETRMISQILYEDWPQANAGPAPNVVISFDMLHMENIAFRMNLKKNEFAYIYIYIFIYIYTFIYYVYTIVSTEMSCRLPNFRNA